MSRPRLPLAKRLAFGIFALWLAAAGVEGAARAYSAIRFDNAKALTYGLDFAARLARGDAPSFDTDPGPEATEQEAVTDAAFDHRNTGADDGLVERAAEDIVFNGIPTRRNSWGFRGEDIAPDAPPGVTRIVTLGGSFVFGAGLTDEEAWPFVLERNLEARGVRADVVNGGVGGANVHKVLVTLLRLSQRARFDYALVISACNNHALLRVERNFTWARRLDAYLYNLSLAHVMLKEKASRLGGEPVDFALYRQRVRVRPEEVERLLATYRRRLEQMPVVCRERGITMVMGSQPQVFFDETVSALDLMSESDLAPLGARLAAGDDLWLMELEFYLQARMNVEARRFAAERGVLFFDAVGAFPKDYRHLFLDQIHPGPEGSRLLADRLAAFFAARIGRTSTVN